MLPWLQEAQQRNPDAVEHMFDCDKCRNGTASRLGHSLQTRQSWGCGWEKPDPRVPVNPWDHPGRDRHPSERDANGKLHLAVCPGYVISLSEVVEASWAQAYWDKGGLDQFCDGQSTPHLRDAMHIFAVEQSKARDWAIRNPEKKS